MAIPGSTTNLGQISIDPQYLTFDQLFELHQNAKNPKYYQRTPEPYYYSVADSLNYCEKLLLHQYGDYEQVKNFLQRLFDITEKIIPKKNTMHIIGEANSGKSWFFEMVASFHLNIGHVKNFNKFTSFPLNDCPNRRILIWNEPSIGPSQFETVNTLRNSCTLCYRISIR